MSGGVRDDGGMQGNQGIVGCREGNCTEDRILKTPKNLLNLKSKISECSCRVTIFLRSYLAIVEQCQEIEVYRWCLRNMHN